MIVGAILFVVAGIILLKFGKAIAQVLLLVGLLMVSIWLYFGLTPTMPELGPGMPPAIPEAIPTPAPTPRPEGWLGALSDAATVVRAFRPEKRSEPVQQVQAVPPQASVTTGGGGLLPMFCAGAALTVALQALGVAAWFYIRWQYDGKLQLPLPTPRRRAEGAQSRGPANGETPTVYLIDCTDEQTPQRGTARLDLLGDDWGF